MPGRGPWRAGPIIAPAIPLLKDKQRRAFARRCCFLLFWLKSSASFCLAFFA
jgi:hypothetical protein